MKKLLIFLCSVLVLVALGACDVGDNPTAHDWCYFFNFDTGDYGAGIVYGSWSIIDGIGGFTSDESGRLSFSYSQATTVTPTFIDVMAARASGVTGPIDVSANGIIFGIGTGNNGFSGTLPAEQVSVNISLLPDTAGEQGASFNISVQSSATIQVRRLEVQGLGVNPFPIDNCGILTSTPSATQLVTETASPTSVITLTPSDTPTPTDTVTPTYTPSSTATSTATATPTGFWCNVAVINFDGHSDVPWTMGGFAPRLVPGFQGQGLSGGTDAPDIHGFYNSGFPYTIPFIMQLDPTWNVQYVTWWEKNQPGVDYFASEHGLRNQNDDSLLITGPIATSNGWNQYELNEVGIGGSTGFETLSLTYYIDSLMPSDLTIDDVTICYDGTPFTPTPSITPTPTNTGTVTVTRTPTVSRTPNPSASATFTPPPIGTASTATGTRTATSTRIAISTPPPATGITPGTLPPTTTPFMTGTIGAATGTSVALTSTAATPNMTMTSAAGTPIVIPWPTGAPGNGPGSCNGVGCISQIGGAIIGGISNVMGQGIGWVQSIGNVMGNIISDWKNAPVRAIPGLPNCTTNPLSSELCAIYYILKNTLFVGLIGSLIMPAATIIVDLVVVFTFLKRVRAIVARLAEVLKV